MIRFFIVEMCNADSDSSPLREWPIREKSFNGLSPAKTQIFLVRHSL